MTIVAAAVAAAAALQVAVDTARTFPLVNAGITSAAKFRCLGLLAIGVVDAAFKQEPFTPD